MPDFDLVRAYYFDPPSLDSRDASDEALIARYERRRFERCILRMGDPAAEGLGPHGSMIGGPGKPATLHHERAERTAPIDPLPLSWWDYPRARLRLLPPGGQQAAYSYLRDLAGAHLAGVPNRPSALRLAAMFRFPRLSLADRDILAQLFGALPPPRFKSLRTLGGVSLYEMARALHVTRNRRNAFVRWINQFAVRPDTVLEPFSPASVCSLAVHKEPVAIRPRSNAERSLGVAKCIVDIT